MVALLTCLTKKDQPFYEGVEINNVFQSLKNYFMTTPLLIHEDPSKPFVLEMDTFNFVIDVMLSQLGEYNFFHPVNFHSHKSFFTKINYDIRDNFFYNHHGCL
jgi:hypothetical protein